MKISIKVLCFQGALHVCVKPFHFHYGRSEWLIEWMELNRLLGVSHFYMYNKTMSEQTTCLLNHYRQHYGLVTLLPWNLPIVSVTEIRLVQILDSTVVACA